MGTVQRRKFWAGSRRKYGGTPGADAFLTLPVCGYAAAVADDRKDHTW